MDNYSSDRVRPQHSTAGAARKSWERARCVLQNNQLAACKTLAVLAVVSIRTKREDPAVQAQPDTEPRAAADGICHTTPSPQHNIRTYPSPSRRLSGSRADTSGPSSRRSCAFQSDPLNNMNRPATRRGD